MKLDVNRDVIMLYDYFKVSPERHKQIHDRIMELRNSSKNMGEVVEKIVEEFGSVDNELVYSLVEYGVLRGRDGGVQGGWDVNAFFAKIIKRRFGRKDGENK